MQQVRTQLGPAIAEIRITLAVAGKKNSKSWRRFTVLLVQKGEMQSSGLGCYDKKVVCWQNRES